MTNYINSIIIFFRFHPKGNKKEVPRGRLPIQFYAIFIARDTNQIERIEHSEMLLGVFSKMGFLEQLIFRGFHNHSTRKLYHFLSIKPTANREELPAIRSSVFAIKYCQKIVNHHDPCNSELVNYVLQGIKVRLSPSTNFFYYLLQ